VERLVLASTKPCAPERSWNPSPGLLAPFRAAGTLALGGAAGTDDPIPASDLWDAVLEREPFLCRRGLSPSPAATALLDRVAMALRSGDGAALTGAFRSALDAEPGTVALAAALATEFLPEAQGTALARVLVEALCAEGGRRSFAVMEGLLAAPFEPRGSFQGSCRKAFPEVEAALRADGSEDAVLQAVFDLLGAIGPPSVLDRGFRHTPLAAQARLLSLQNEVQLLHGTGHPREAMDRVETLIAEFPDNPRAPYCAAWFLLAANDKTIRNPDRAAALAGRAVELAVCDPEEHGTVLAFCLEMLARAQAQRGDLAEAVRSQERALEALLPSQSAHRPRMEEGLRHYRQRLEEQGR
jgi:hypothetical protein